jgi:flagella basal body P-ring formation protein FlgA
MLRFSSLAPVVWAVVVSLASTAMADTADLPPNHALTHEVLALSGVSAQAFEFQLGQWLQRRFEQSGSKVQVEPIGSWGTLPLALADVKAAIHMQTRSPDGWQVTVAVTATAQGAEKVFERRFRVREMHAVWVASASMRKGDALSCTCVQKAQRTGRSLSAAWQSPCESLQGLLLRKPLAAGDVLMASDVSEPLAVSQQQVAVVTARLGDVLVQGEGVVLSDAHIGQTVSVRMSGQTTVIQGLVTAPGQVQVTGGTR